MGFFFGISKKLLKRITEIEIDTHYYDTDVVPSAQDIFTFDVDTKNKTAIITGFTDDAKNITECVMPYRVQYGNDTSQLWATVVAIKDGAFKDRTYLQNITIPNTIHVISKNCFNGCSSLHKVNISKSINSINSNAFSNCISLNNLLIPYGVKTIEENAFNECDNLKILCYKYSTAEEYAITNNIKYSLISYTLDEDITENSPNLVTSGIIYTHIKNVLSKISNHINNKLNPHDNSSFDNSNLTGNTTINTATVNNMSDNDLSVVNKKYVDDADKNINETLNKHINNKINPHDDSIFNNVTLNGNTKVSKGTLDNISTEDSSLINKKYVDNISKEIKDNLQKHLDDKNNPHDDSTFKNTILDGDTSINKGILNEVQDLDKSLVNKKYVDDSIQSAIDNIDINVDGDIDLSTYQTKIDNNLATHSQTITGAINEINDKVHTVNGKLSAGWNTVLLDKLYPISWRFLNKPYCYTDEGIDVDYRIDHLNITSDDNSAFDIYVPVDCNYTLSTTECNDIAGYPIDYIVLSYYYTGADGKDLDTITAINNENWPLSNNYVGYTSDGSNHKTITNSTGTTLVQWGGDNTGGGDGESNKYYESVYFNLKAIQEQLPNEDVEIVLYATWYNTIGNGHINAFIYCYTCDEVPTITTNNKQISLSGENLVNTYSNTSSMSCNIITKGGSNVNPTDYKEKYTPAYKLVFKKSSGNSNYRTISIYSLN